MASTELLVPGLGEIAGGSQREERLDALERRIAACGLGQWQLCESAESGFSEPQFSCVPQTPSRCSGTWICDALAASFMAVS